MDKSWYTGDGGDVCDVATICSLMSGALRFIRETGGLGEHTYVNVCVCVRESSFVRLSKSTFDMIRSSSDVRLLYGPTKNASRHRRKFVVCIQNKSRVTTMLSNPGVWK